MSTYTFTKIEQNTNARQVLAEGMVSLSKTGRIGLGKQFVEQHGLNTDSRANLYWDDANKAIAISFSAEGDNQEAKGNYVKIKSSDGYTVGFVNGDAGYIVSSSFFKQIGVDPSEHVGHYRYEVLKGRDAGIPDIDSQDEVFVVHLEG